LSGWSTERCPKVVHGDIEAPNLAALGDYISRLYAAGMPLFPHQVLEGHLRSMEPHDYRVRTGIGSRANSA
jgi:hypothetical protein